jgi:hypothetical protein
MKGESSMEEGREDGENRVGGEGRGKPDAGNDRVGPFPSWRALYWTVVVYGLVMISVLAVLTQALSFGAHP